MALSARFGADFSQLVDALGDVEVKIKSLADKAAASGPQFARMVNEFNGTKIEQQAAIMVAAITKVGEKEGLLGGIARLTAAEQAKVNVLVTEAIAKYNAMGKLAPVDLRLLEDATKKVVTETQKIQPATHSAASGLRELAGAFGMVLSVGAVVAFGKALLADADALVKLSDKTGILIEPLQRLKYVAEQSGNTLENVTNSVSMLQKRVAGGDDSAEQALRSLGIAVADFIRLSPDQQFRAIAVEVAKIEDPMRRAKVATDLFGRAGTEILPTLIADIETLGNAAPVMSEKATRAFDDIGDTANRVWATVKNKTGEGLATAFDSYARLAKIASRAWLMEFSGAAKAALDLDELGTPRTPGSPALPALPGTSVALSMDEAAVAAKHLTDVVRDQTEATKQAAADAKKLADQMDAMSGQKLITDTNELVATYGRLAAQGLKPTYAELVKVNVIMAEATAAAQRNGSTIPTAWAQVTLASKSLSDHMGAYATAAQNAADQSDAINEAVSVLPSRARATGQAFDETTEAMRRMANLMPEVKDQTTEINAAFDDLAKKKAEAMRKALGNVTDAMDGFSRVAEMAGHKTTASIITVASTTIKAFASGGPVAGAIALVTGLFTALGDKLFKTAQKALNDTRDLFITSQGGFDALNVAAAKAGAQSSFLALLQAKNTKTYEAALTKLNTILQKTSELEAARIAAVPVWETVSALAQKYGISVEAAGQAVQQLMITANAKTMINDWQTWAKAGGNMDAMAAGMAKSMSTLVQQSLAFGTTLPENLRPVLDFLSGAGILVDAAGNKIDVGSLSFGPEVQTEMERMTKAIEDLVAELRALNGLPAASTGLSGLVAEQNARMGASWKTAEYGGEQALGGDYLVTRPTLFLAGEAGPERATFRPAGGGSSQPILITVISTLDGREVARNQVRYLPNQLKLAGL